MELKRDLPPLLVRADADEARGTGHVMRCLALACGWMSRGGRVCFLTYRLNPNLLSRIQAAGATVMEISKCHPNGADLKTTVAVVQETVRTFKGFPWIVLDGYHFDGAYQSILRPAGCRVLAIDDNAHLPFYNTDLVLNHGIHAVKLAYGCSSTTKLLLGTAYALLRDEFRRCAGMARSTAVVARKILVTLGGSDPGNATYKVVEALEQVDIPDLEIRIVVGAVNPHLQTLNRLVSESRLSISLETAVKDMSSSMLWADVAVTAAGGTCWELACLGVPMVNIIVAENQKMIAAELAAAGVSLNLGWQQKLSVSRIAPLLSELFRAPQRRAQMAVRGKAMVDGLGVKRVVDTMLQESFLRAA